MGYNLSVMPSDWRDRFTLEIQRARTARLQGNEGMARVCARRAAGIAIRAYLERWGIITPPSSAYELCQWLLNRPDTSPEARDISTRLLLRVSEERELPSGVDLIEDANRLPYVLGLNPEIE